jgi:group I intron endonuclease
MTGIYKIINLKTNQSYIGKSNNIERRWNEHKASSTNRLKIDKDINEYGIKNFKLEVVKTCKSSELKRLEEEEIKKQQPYYNTKVLDNSISEKTKRKISKSNKLWWNNLPQETQNKIITNNLTHKGWKNGYVPQSVKEKISNTLKGKYTKKVIIVEINKQFNSVGSCAEYLHTDSSYISHCLSGRYKTVKGYHIKRCRD